MRCPFCAFVRGLGPRPESLDVSDDVISFVPLNPIVDGHRLFVPTTHVEDAAHDPALTGRVFARASAWAGAGRPFNLITSTGSAATQTVFHLHVHYVPRSPGDGLLLPWSE